MEGWKSGRLEEWKAGRMEGWKGGRMEEWKGGRMEEGKGGRPNRLTVSYCLLAQLPIYFLKLHTVYSTGEDMETDGLFVSEIRAQFIDENDLPRVVIKRIWEAYDSEVRQWQLKRVEYIFEDPDYPVPSEPLNIAVESRHGWLIPPEWEFELEVWVYTRQPSDRPPKGHTYDHEGLVGIIR